MRIDELSSTAFAKAMEADPIVFLPLGACEAHGPHLPLGTDTFQPEETVTQVAKRVGGLVAPTINYGQHSSTLNMPGTISLTFDTLRSLVKDILESLHRNKVHKVVVLTGHFGSVHRIAIKLACEHATQHLGMKVMMLSDYQLALHLEKEICQGLEDGHGGLLETSRIMDIRPDLVAKERSHGEFVDSGYLIVSDPERCFPKGFSGDAGLASEEKGRRINTYIVDTLTELVRANFEG
ncbi:MAG: creatininase family protein [Methanomassiliicoccales archaeon]|nr:creatininase family protein [Methanomassiliicoccales archaeon]